MHTAPNESNLQDDVTQDSDGDHINISAMYDIAKILHLSCI
jgi:hypothetical protein